MERLTDDQVTQLVRFVLARIPDATSLHGEARRTAAALRWVAERQVTALRFHQASPPAHPAASELAGASWNLLVNLAHVWHDHPNFPANIAIETFEFDSPSPLPTTVRPNPPRQ